MSAAKRLVSGTAASWGRILGTLVTQILLIPLFLSHWNVKTYGYWIAIQAFVNIASTLDRGYVDFLGFEFLKLGAKKRDSISEILSSGLIVLLWIALLETSILLVFAFSPYFSIILGELSDLSSEEISQARWSLVLFWSSWIFCSNTTGLFFRALAPLGYFPRMAWWDFYVSITTSILSVIIVVAGGDLLVTSIGTALISVIFAALRFGDIRRIMKKEGLAHSGGKISAGISYYKSSLLLSGRYLLDNTRQQGIRLIVAPLLGVRGLAQFSTTRTVSNVMQQGLMTITNPLLPELMRFLNEKNQSKTEASLSSVWLIVIAVISPACLILQIFAESFFKVWTNNQIEYDPLLLMALSISVLVYAVSQPAIAIVTGNNLLRPQILNSIISTATLLVLITPFCKFYGIIGTGLALLASEIISLINFSYVASRWLRTNNLKWPKNAFTLTCISPILTTISIVLIHKYPHFKTEILAIGFLLYSILMYFYWKTIPLESRKKLLDIVNSMLNKLNKKLRQNDN